MKDIKSASFHPRLIAQLLRENKLEKVKPGLYRLTDLKLKEDIPLGFLDVCHATPKGVICLVSALSHYALTTFNPADIHVAIPASEKPTAIIFPPAKFYYFPKRFYEFGIQRIKTAAGTVSIYNREKTICDMFRYRLKLGEDLAIEGLKNYLNTKHANLSRLQAYAVRCGVKSVLIPYIRALVG